VSETIVWMSETMVWMSETMVWMSETMVWVNETMVWVNETMVFINYQSIIFLPTNPKLSFYPFFCFQTDFVISNAVRNPQPSCSSFICYVCIIAYCTIG